jgi:hypothetical protein
MLSKFNRNTIPTKHKQINDKKQKYQIYKYSQLAVNATYGNLDGGTTDKFFAFSFQLNDLANVTAFTNLYDQYRIVKVEMWARHNQLVNSSDSSNTIKNALFVASDHDDTTLWTSVTQAYQYQDVRHCGFNEDMTFTVNPRVALAAYNGTFVGYANLPSTTWLDCATANVQHYGVKVCVTASGTSTATTSWKLYFKYFIEFRQVI